MKKRLDKKCVECKETIKAPSQTNLCEKCFQDMLNYKLDTLGEKKEVIKA